MYKRQLTGKPLARFWVHHGHVTVWKEKMSKSRGNFVLARQAVKRHGADAVRLFLLSAPYREGLDYDPGGMRRWSKLARDHAAALARARRAGGRTRPSAAWDGWATDFGAALDDDLDTPRALALMEEGVRGARAATQPAEAAAAARGLRGAGEALGLSPPPRPPGPRPAARTARPRAP